MRGRVYRILRKGAKAPSGVGVELDPIEVEMLKVLLRDMVQSERKPISVK